jgi:hypothetical protein
VIGVVERNDVVDTENDDRWRCEMGERGRETGGYGRGWKKWLVIYLVAGR